MEKDLAKLISNMEKSLEAIIKILKKSGLKVNKSKTEVCFSIELTTTSEIKNSLDNN